MLRKPLFVLILAAATSLLGFAQNPICPMGVYIADPTSRVAPDGQLYIYGSCDVQPNAYCSDTYHVLSSPDGCNWTLHRNSFKWKTILYAPDLMLKDGTYYLYYCTPEGKDYVATGDSPVGPFKDGVWIEGPQQIDPAIFIDDDGQAYYYWGQFSAKGAKMNPDMKTLDMSTYKDSLATEKDHGFHEGSYMIKRGEYYYLIYADISRNHRPTCIGYSMSTSPLGPFEYKGVIIDNAGCDPAVWNDHGSIVEFNGQWYVLYHRATHGNFSMRKACIEPIYFNEDGTIDEVEMTSQGAGKPLDAFKIIDGARACQLRGHVRIERSNPSHEVLGQIEDGDKACWKYIDFGKGAKFVSVKVKAPKGGKVSIRIDAEDGPEVGTVEIPASVEWQEVTSEIQKTKGVHALWMAFDGPIAMDRTIFMKKAPKAKKYPATDEPLRIATFNNQYEHKAHPWADRRSRVSALIADRKWDIVGMQEPFWNQMEDMDTTLTEYAWVGNSTDGKVVDGYWHYNPIFYSKDRLEMLEWGSFWFSETPDVPMSKAWDTHTSRFCVWGHFLDKHTGKDFYEFNCHYDHKGELARQNTSRLLLKKTKEIAGDKPFFINGDFNTEEGTPSCTILTYGGMVDALDAAEVKEGDKTLSWTDWKPIQVVDSPSHLDHIFITPGTKALSWKLISKSYEGGYPSDHFPVEVEWVL